jgi:hypothetical protein
MRRITTIIPAALLVVGAAGCNSFLDSDKATSDPNSPSVASRNQLFVGAQASVFGQQEGGIAMLICQWMQQCAGVNGRFVDTQSNYNINAGTFDFQFSDVYRGGGLRAIRAVQASADAAGDKYYKGVAEVIEAMNIGFAADVWGNIPYREAAGDNPTPAYDPQLQVYDDLQKLLDQAITDINGAGAGPGGFDLVYGDLSAAAQKTAWIQAAHTLKARLYLHTVEAASNKAEPLGAVPDLLVRRRPGRRLGARGHHESRQRPPPPRVLRPQRPRRLRRLGRHHQDDPRQSDLPDPRIGPYQQRHVPPADHDL